MCIKHRASSSMGAAALSARTTSMAFSISLQCIPNANPYGSAVRMLSGNLCIVTHERPEEPLMASSALFICGDVVAAMPGAGARGGRGDKVSMW